MGWFYTLELKSQNSWTSQRCHPIPARVVWDSGSIPGQDMDLWDQTPSKSRELPSGIPIFQAWNLKERSGRGELRLCGVKEGKSRWDPTEFPSPAASSLRARHSRLWDVLGTAILKIKAATRRSGAANAPRGHRPGLENASGEGGESSGSLPEFPAAPIPAPRAGNSLGLFFPVFYVFFFFPWPTKPLLSLGSVPAASCRREFVLFFLP